MEIGANDSISPIGAVVQPIEPKIIDRIERSKFLFEKRARLWDVP
jgi:hypothetical protein